MEQPASFDEDPPPEPREGWLLVRIHVPELNVYKCLQFPSERLVWDVKQQVLASLPKELKESFNYGLFCPPLNGRAGKFLDEERRLGDYPFNGPVGYLELKYKRRVYKMLNLDEKQLKAVHTRANLRRFLECINGGHVDKIAKMCAKGLDPNFHCPESGDTPLTQATGAKKPNKLLIALVNGGALLDYRTKDGSTALHRAVERDCLEAVTTLLELGASPNYKDARGLTPLYLSVTKKTDSKICESLLHDHGTLGIQDTQGWQEVHQACRHGLVQHLEHLLFYGADMDGHNASGNTSLHVCAVNNQEACARMLLFRGAQRGALNYANQTPYQVAVIAGNMELAEMIQNYKSEDIVPFRGPPRYNPRRRSGIGWGTTLSRIGGPPSPCPSEHPFSSASSSLSEGSSSHRSHEDDISIVTDKSIGDTSDIISDSSGVGTNSDSAACSIGHPSTTVVCMQPYTGTSLGHLSIQPGDVIDVVGSTDCGLLEGFVRGVNRSGFFPEHCVQEVNIRQKNIHNVSTAAAGEYRGTVMLQPQQQQQQPQTTHHHHQASSYSSATAPRIKKSVVPDSRTVVLHRAQRGFGFILRGAKAASPLMQLKPSDRCPGLQYLDHVDPGGVADMAGLRPGDFLLEINGEDVRCASHEQVVDLIRNSKSLVAMTVVSQNFPNNFQHQIQSQQQQQQQQQSDHYQQSPTFATHQQHSHNGGSGSTTSAARQCATLPRKMGGLSGAAGGGVRSPAPQPPRRDPKTTLSVGRARAKSMVAGLESGGERSSSGTLNAHHSAVLLLHGDDEADDVHSTTKSSSAESIHQHSLSSASTPTQTGPGTPVQPRTASIKARPTSSRITAAELEELFQRQQGEAGGHSGCAGGSGGDSGAGGVGAHRYSTMMSSSRFQSGTDSGAATPPAGSPMKAGTGGGGGIVYASVADMKRKKAATAATGGSKTGTLRGKPCAVPVVSMADLKRTFHSTPDLAAAGGGGGVNSLNTSTASVWSAGAAYNNASRVQRSRDDMHLQMMAHAQSMQRLVLPPPTHPPPPPPVGQVVKVDVSRGAEYESTVRLQKQLQEKADAAAMATAHTANGANGDGTSTGGDEGSQEVRSSFKPAANAKLYASPQDIRMVGFRSRAEPQQTNGAAPRHQLRKSMSTRSDSDVPPMSPSATSTTSGGGGSSSGNNAYAQPGIASNAATNLPPSNPALIPHQSLPMSANGNGNNNQRCHTMPTKLLQAPPIPDPDYSLSESDGETETSILVAHNTKMNAQIGNGGSGPHASNSSGNSGTSMSHSFSVDEIQKMRVKLKASTSYPNDLLAQQQQQQLSQMHLEPPPPSHEEGDNSSSGVSSDQEMTIVSAVPYPVANTVQPPPPILKTSQAYQQQHSMYAVTGHNHSYNNNNNNNAASTLKSAKSSTSAASPADFKSQHLHHHNHHHHPVKTIDMDREAALQAAADEADAVDERDQLDMDSPSPPAKGFQRHNSLTRKQAATIAMNRAMQARNNATSVVSLVKLPPPIESDDQDEPDHAMSPQMYHTPMMIEANAVAHHHTLRRPKLLAKAGATAAAPTQQSTTVAAATEHIVLAPPPQFCDCVHSATAASAPVGLNGGGGGGGGTGRAGARIVGALPKVNTNVNVVNEMCENS